MGVLGKEPIIMKYSGCGSPLLVAPKWVLSRHCSGGVAELLAEIKTYIFNLCTASALAGLKDRSARENVSPRSQSKLMPEVPTYLP